uniref:uS10m n=1 Tax=Polytomella magna TaxID=353565 RepID=UPI002240E4B0|nr:Chain Bj, uS10m [Polytomella magna]8APN_Bj Chain Bj, uS10m [Polytomella magna]8APO_Bj Chain Bj, uS10m [Polytomella magna]
NPTDSFYEIELTVKAYEERYVDMAVNALRDLLMISFTPKKFSPMGQGRYAKDIEPNNPIDLYIPTTMERVKVDWKKTRFTLIRGPFVDKRGMEQFERREYHSKIKASTTSLTELQWLLDALKLYEFTGVQIEAEVTSPGFVAAHEHQAVLKTSRPTHGEAGDFVDSLFLDDQSSILDAGHLRHIKDFVPSGFGSEMQTALAALRNVMHQGLEERRRALGMNSGYDAWLRQQQRVGSATVTKLFPASGLASSSSLLDEAATPADLSTLLLKSQIDSAAAVRDRKVAAFLAAVDAVFLNLRFDALEGHARFPFHFATAVPGQMKVPVAMWMQAVSKMAEYQRQVSEASQAADLLKAYTSYSAFSQALLYKLMQLWFETASSDAKEYLALPSWEEYEAMVQAKR